MNKDKRIELYVWPFYKDINKRILSFCKHIDADSCVWIKRLRPAYFGILLTRTAPRTTRTLHGPTLPPPSKLLSVHWFVAGSCLQNKSKMAEAPGMSAQEQVSEMLISLFLFRDISPGFELLRN